ncbi:ankyrin repeat protein [Apiospora sp. TS-2023a]
MTGTSFKGKRGWRVPGTCQWIRDHPDYHQWFHGHTGRLWISGGPGMGKTMLSIFLTEELEAYTQHNDGLLICYFCRHDDDGRNTEISVLRGLLYQLVQNISTGTFQQKVWPKFASEESASYTVLNLATMWRIFGDILTATDLESIYCVLDGLDECHEDSSKQIMQRFHTFFIDKSARFPSIFRLAIVSRELPGLSGFATIRLDRNNTNIQHDIELFISRSIEDALSHKAGFDADYLERLSGRLLRGSEGSFLWTGFVLKDVSAYETPREVTRALDHTPEGLEPMYYRILHQIYGKHRDHRDHIYRLLVWVSLAFRPLTTLELTRAVMFSVSYEHKEYLKDLLSYCKQVLVLDDRDDREQTVRLVHASAKELLVKSPATVSSNHAPNHTNVEVGHHMITRVCLELLERDEKDDALGQYATKQWLRHIKSCRAEDTKSELSRPFFKNMKIVEQQWEPELWGRWRIPPNALHAATQWGIMAWAEKLLARPTSPWAYVRRRRYLKTKSHEGSTPLMVAVAHCDLDMVELLLHCGADVVLHPDSVDTASIMYRSALIEALKDNGFKFSSHENFEPWKMIIELLLQHLKKPTWFSMVTSMEFRCACANRMGGSLAQMFLKHCQYTQKDHKAAFNCTALVKAAESGHVAVVERLLEYGADPESRFGKENALCAAITGREPLHRETILGMLLDSYDAKTCSVRAMDHRHVLLQSLIKPTDYECPAYHRSFEKTPRESELECVLKSEDGKDKMMPAKREELTTFYIAVSYGHCIKLCLSKIGRFSQSGYSGGPELIAALRAGHTSAARLLLENGASVNTVNHHGDSVLILATKYGDWDVAEFLLDQGADVNVIGFESTTAMIEAVSETCFYTKPYRTKDSAANFIRDECTGFRYKFTGFRDKKLQIVSRLLNQGASTHFKSLDGRTALSVAAGLGDAETVEALMDHGAKITMNDTMSDRGLWRWYVTFYQLRTRGVLSSLRCERLLAFRLKTLSKRRRSKRTGGTALDVRDGGNSWDGAKVYMYLEMRWWELNLW